MASKFPRPQQLILISEILTDVRKYNVCYADNVKVEIERQLQTLLTHFPTLSAKYEEYTYNDGRTVGMVKLTGTIPIYYNQAKYNIPLIIWIPETYPKSPPIVYLTPTKGMVIKDDHHSVDKNGLVETIYIRSWNPQHCELLGMVHDMTQGFSKNPPLFAQSTSRPSMNRSYPMRTSPPPREPVQSQRTHEYTQGMGLFPQNQTYPQRTAELSLPSPPSTSPPPNDASMEYIKRRYRESLIRVLSERVRQSVYELIRNGRPEPGKAKEIHATLCRRRQELAQRIHTLQAEREGYEHDVQVMAAAIDEINAWMSNLGLSSLQSGESLRPEDVIVPQDPLAEQLLAAQAEDLAAEDCLNALDKLFEKEKLDLETYLKQIRKVCRIQYFARALTMKITEMERNH